MKTVSLISVAACCLASVAYAGEFGMDPEMKAKFDRYNVLTTCYGMEPVQKYYQAIDAAAQKCKQSQLPSELISALETASSSDLEALDQLLSANAIAALVKGAGADKRRRRRQLAETEELIASFQTGLREHIVHTMMKIGNVTCVMGQMQMLKEDGTYNMDGYSYEALKEYEFTAPGAEDDEFLQCMAEGFEDCNAIAEAWPQQHLDRHPMTRLMGRNMVFFKCAFKAEEEMCYKKQMYQAIKIYGLDTGSEELQQVPGANKFEKALNMWNVLYESMGEEYDAVHNYFWSRKNKM